MLLKIHSERKIGINKRSRTIPNAVRLRADCVKVALATQHCTLHAVVSKMKLNRIRQNAMKFSNSCSLIPCVAFPHSTQR
jgi:hypothetical protein